MKSPLLNYLLLLLPQFVTVSLTLAANEQQIDKRRTSNVCNSTADCPLNAMCEERGGGISQMGQCVCRDGYFMKASGRSRKCIEIADYGELCFMNEQCHFRLGYESHCFNQQCDCQPRAHYVRTENACFNSSKIGEYCRLTSNCQVNRTICEQGQCRCFYGYHPNHAKTRCLKNINLNENCYSDEECVVNASICLNGKCRCKASHVAGDDGDSCLPLVSSLYQPCQQDSQCMSIPYSSCAENNTCLCIKNYHDVNSRCWSSVSLNGICESDENCVIAHTSCINKRCSCDDGFVEENNQGSKYCSNAERVQISFLIVLMFIFSLTKIM